ncbi:unnamed protein product [Soboliphyme baturini]|uniref:Uncharacterized protein n=1 Tax=Soboliphyme baturini TaxID=241478 RepID=A0A183IDS4_9BILA|nr:unnamed protein product [Soboliphyme baturini]
MDSVADSVTVARLDCIVKRRSMTQCNVQNVACSRPNGLKTSGVTRRGWRKAGHLPQPAVSKPARRLPSATATAAAAFRDVLM